MAQLARTMELAAAEADAAAGRVTLAGAGAEKYQGPPPSQGVM